MGVLGTVVFDVVIGWPFALVAFVLWKDGAFDQRSKPPKV
jgi:hypothetical protein